MKTFVASALALAAGTQALVSRDTTCCFGLSASGAVGGVVGQLSDGQNRVGDHSLPAGKYCINSNGGITDAHGRGCFLTPPTQQLQCDVGQFPVPGFAVGSGGSLSYNGNSHFYECNTGQNGGYNIYTKSDVNTGCSAISLTADQCFPKPPPPAPPAPVKVVAAPSKSCPANLSGKFEFPHLIVPVSSSHPDQASGTSFFGTVSSDTSSLFNFDIPSSDTGTCSLVFLFPMQKDLVTSSFTFSGTGGIDFARLNSVATSQTTFKNAPSVMTDYGVINVSPGNSYTIASFPCPAGQKIAFSLKSAGVSLNYFQDFNPSPIGLYITAC